jgi:hypothetical protein
MGRIFKALVILAILGLIGLAGFAYLGLGNMAPERSEVSVPVTLDVD